MKVIATAKIIAARIRFLDLPPAVSLTLTCSPGSDGVVSGSQRGAAASKVATGIVTESRPQPQIARGKPFLHAG
jgi:hypothetical protein